MDLSPLSKVIPSWDAKTLQGFDTSHVQDGQRIKGDDRQFVRFYKKVVPVIYSTRVKINEKTGATQILEQKVKEVEREFVQIKTPGDTNEVDDFAEDFHRREHWRHYKAFRDGRTAPIGTPIDEATFISSHVATELRYMGVHVVEQLADASDHLCQTIPNGFELREFAKTTVKAQTKENPKLLALMQELEETKAKVLLLEQGAQPQETKVLVSAIEKPKGRPKKITEVGVE